MEQEFITNKEIREMANCGVNKACQIRKIAITRFNGFNPVLPKKTRKEAIIKVLELLKMR